MHTSLAFVARKKAMVFHGRIPGRRKNVKTFDTDFADERRLTAKQSVKICEICVNGFEVTVISTRCVHRVALKGEELEKLALMGYRRNDEGAGITAATGSVKIPRRCCQRAQQTRVIGEPAREQMKDVAFAL